MPYLQIVTQKIGSNVSHYNKEHPNSKIKQKLMSRENIMASYIRSPNLIMEENISADIKIMLRCRVLP